MKTLFHCNNCGHDFGHEGETTIRVRDGQVRLYNTDNEPIDICPCCEALAEEVKINKGLCTNWSSTKGGVAGSDWSGSASK